MTMLGRKRSGSSSRPASSPIGGDGLQADHRHGERVEQAALAVQQVHRARRARRQLLGQLAPTRRPARGRPACGPPPRRRGRDGTYVVSAGTWRIVSHGKSLRFSDCTNACRRSPSRPAQPSSRGLQRLAGHRLDRIAVERDDVQASAGTSAIHSCSQDRGIGDLRSMSSNFVRSRRPCGAASAAPAGGHRLHASTAATWRPRRPTALDADPLVEVPQHAVLARARDERPRDHCPRELIVHRVRRRSRRRPPGGGAGSGRRRRRRTPHSARCTGSGRATPRRRRATASR